MQGSVEETETKEVLGEVAGDVEEYLDSLVVWWIEGRVWTAGEEWGDGDRDGEECGAAVQENPGCSRPLQVVQMCLYAVICNANVGVLARKWHLAWPGRAVSL